MINGVDTEFEEEEGAGEADIKNWQAPSVEKISKLRI